MGEDDYHALDANGDAKYWRIDPSRSRARFVAHGMWGLLPAHGQLNVSGGYLERNDQGRFDGQLELDARSISTGMRIRDWHLRSKQLLGVQQNPAMTVSLRDGADVSGRLTGSYELTVVGQHTQLSAAAQIETADSGHVTMRHATEIDLRSLNVVPRAAFLLGLLQPRIAATVDLVLNPS